MTGFYILFQGQHFIEYYYQAHEHYRVELSFPIKYNWAFIENNFKTYMYNLTAWQI